MTRVALAGAHIGVLLDDLERAVEEFASPLERDGDLWTRSIPRKWTAGQIAEHVASSMELAMAAFEQSSQSYRSGTLPPVPWRGPLQWLFFATVVKPGKMPEGGRAMPQTYPAAMPNRITVLRRLPVDVERYRSFAGRFSAEELDRIWIRNPFTPLRWHYRFPELVRVQAVHARHHLRQVLRTAVEAPA
jgi:hypothetical protein